MKSLTEKLSRKLAGRALPPNVVSLRERYGTAGAEQDLLTALDAYMVVRRWRPPAL